MSIIYDALKKVEKSRKISLETKTDKDYRPKSKIKIYLLYGLIVCSSFFIASIFFAFLQTPLQNNPRVLAKNQSPSNLKPDVNIIKEPRTEPPSTETSSPVVNQTQNKAEPLEKPKAPLTLNGVFFSQDEGYALINNQIVKEGDVVEGARVALITLEGVELVFEGKLIKLSTNK